MNQFITNLQFFPQNSRNPQDQKYIRNIRTNHIPRHNLRRSLHHCQNRRHQFWQRRPQSHNRHSDNKRRNPKKLPYLLRRLNKIIRSLYQYPQTDNKNGDLNQNVHHAKSNIFVFLRVRLFPFFEKFFLIIKTFSKNRRKKFNSVS